MIRMTYRSTAKFYDLFGEKDDLDSRARGSSGHSVILTVDMVEPFGIGHLDQGCRETFECRWIREMDFHPLVRGSSSELHIGSEYW